MADPPTAVRIEERQTEPLGWQPIESAPKGELVIVYFKEGGITTRRLCATRWDDRVRWRDIIGNPGSTPTHWMPLPAPPETR